MELFCDVLLALGALAFPAGVALIVWGCIAKFEPIRIVAGGALAILGPLVLLLWERLAWEPFFKRLSRMD